jgi:quercetin 2,3-dioxygenase
MIKKVTNSEKFGNSHISILFPGKALGNVDTGIGSLGRIDQANIGSRTTIKMHPHVNDEILSYFRTGRVIHTDSSTKTETITRKRLMLMKAGKIFYHEEQIIDRLEGLQIFIRPQTKDYDPEVLFYELENADSVNVWRLLASNEAKAPLRFTSETEIYDIQINNPETYQTPKSLLANQAAILYVFQGNVRINDELSLTKGECIVFEHEQISFNTTSEAELVLFVTNKNQACFKGGMFSGNQM